MGYTKRPNRVGGQITDFTPDNTPDTLYINAKNGVTLEDMAILCEAHFGAGSDPRDLSFSAEHIHTYCIGYDQYDPGDYTNYIVITKK